MEKERIYMSLLERRIAELEALLSKSDENASTPPDSIASPTREKRFDVLNGDKGSEADRSKPNGTEGDEKKVSSLHVACSNNSRYFSHCSTHMRAPI